MTSRIHTSRHQKPKNLLPTVEKAISSTQKTTLGMLCRMTFLTFKESSSKYKAVGDRKYKLFELHMKINKMQTQKIGGISTYFLISLIPHQSQRQKITNTQAEQD